MDASSLSHDATHAAADAPADTSLAHDRCRLKAVMANEEIAQDVLVAVLDRVDGVPLKVKNDIRIAVEELFVNVASYAYASVGDIELSVTVDGDARAVTVTLTDWGVPFDPFSYAAARPLKAESVEEAPIGGLGIVMVKGLMDECFYRRVDDANEVRIVKRWAAPEPERVPAAPAWSGSGIDDLDKIQGELDDDDLTAIAGGMVVMEPHSWL